MRGSPRVVLVLGWGEGDVEEERRPFEPWCGCTGGGRWDWAVAPRVRGSDCTQNDGPCPQRTPCCFALWPQDLEGMGLDELGPEPQYWMRTQ